MSGLAHRGAFSVYCSVLCTVRKKKAPFRGAFCCSVKANYFFLRGAFLVAFFTTFLVAFFGAAFLATFLVAFLATFLVAFFAVAFFAIRFLLG